MISVPADGGCKKAGEGWGQAEGQTWEEEWERLPENLQPSVSRPEAPFRSTELRAVILIHPLDKETFWKDKKCIFF